MVDDEGDAVDGERLPSPFKQRWFVVTRDWSECCDLDLMRCVEVYAWRCGDEVGEVVCCVGAGAGH